MIKESFSEAKIFFQSFLEQNNLSTDIVWLFSEDVIWTDNQFLINSKSTAPNEILTERFYERGQEINYGIQMFAFCAFDSKIGCSIVLPEDDIDAEYRMMSEESLKCSFRTKLDEAKLIKSNLIWKIQNIIISKNHSRHYADFLPSKKLAVSNRIDNHKFQ